MYDIEKRVHELYWEQDINCARTTLIILGELFGIEIQPQTLHSAIGMHGAGCYRAQCGLVEGALMFFGVYVTEKGGDEKAVANMCYKYASKFEQEFGSLRCYDLRPGGFQPTDPEHMCEQLTAKTVAFAAEFVKKWRI